MDLHTAIHTRRSVRGYAARAIDAEVLGRILEAGRVAPSTSNFQPWRFVVVREPAVKAKLMELSTKQPFIASAAAVVVCCGRKYDNPYNWIGDTMFLIDLAIAIDHLTLAARAEGVGSCWIGGFDNAAIKALLEIPADHDIVSLLTLGYPADAAAFAPCTDRLAIEEIVFGEKYGKALKEG